MKSLHRQKGLSLIGVAILAFLVIFFGLLIIKMSGSYFDQMKLNKMIENSLEGQTASRFQKADFESSMRKNMQINRIEFDIKNSLTIDKRSKPVVLVLDYEKRVHLFANVDVVMSFHEEYEL